MAKTYQTLLDESRAILQDTDADGYRYSTTKLVAALNRGLNELARIRPDAFWGFFSVDHLDIPEVSESGLSASFPIEMQFYAPLVYFVVGSAELMDDEFTVDGRAMTLLAAFKSSCTAV